MKWYGEVMSHEDMRCSRCGHYKDTPNHEFGCKDHDPLCPYVEAPDYRRLPNFCKCEEYARVRADERDQCGYRALEARDRTRHGSDAWSRLDRLAHDLFTSARTLRGGDDD